MSRVKKRKLTRLEKQMIDEDRYRYNRNEARRRQRVAVKFGLNHAKKCIKIVQP